MLWKNMIKKVSIGDRNITSLWFANDIPVDALAEEEQELEVLLKV